jgi:hypothetical protein
MARKGNNSNFDILDKILSDANIAERQGGRSGLLIRITQTVVT